MKSLSQASVAQIIRVFERLKFHAAYVAPLVKDMELELLDAGIPPDLIAAFEKTDWGFRRILPFLQTGKSNEGWIYNLFYGWFEEQMGIMYLLVLAQYACVRVDSLPDHLADVKHMQQELIRRLELDGYTYRNGVLRPTDSSPVDLAHEVDLLTEAIHNSGLPNRELILIHYHNGEDQYAASKWEPAMGEWRKFFERLLRDIAETGVVKRADVKKNTGTMKNIFEYLEALGLFDDEERLMYSNTYGLLCSGTKPGLLPKDLAHGAMVMALVHGQLLLTKYAAWERKGYRF